MGFAREVTEGHFKKSAKHNGLKIRMSQVTRMGKVILAGARSSRQSANELMKLHLGKRPPERRIDNQGEDRLMKEMVGQTLYTSHVIVLLGTDVSLLQPPRGTECCQ